MRNTLLPNIRTKATIVVRNDASGTVVSGPRYAKKIEIGCIGFASFQTTMEIELMLKNRSMDQRGQIPIGTGRLMELGSEGKRAQTGQRRVAQNSVCGCGITGNVRGSSGEIVQRDAGVREGEAASAGHATERMDQQAARWDRVEDSC